MRPGDTVAMRRPRPLELVFVVTYVWPQSYWDVRIAGTHFLHESYQSRNLVRVVPSFAGLVETCQNDYALETPSL